MGSVKKPYLLFPRGKIWYYKLQNETSYHSTGKKKKSEAEFYIKEMWAKQIHRFGKPILEMTLGQLLALSNPNSIDIDSHARWIMTEWHQFSRKERLAILFVLEEGKCHYCGERVFIDGRQMHSWSAAVEAQIDHVRPVSKGGSNYFTNNVLACRQCNLIKGSKLIDGVGA
jgi:DNA-directed RNA polymerase subunit RPC12/RpoP